MTGRAGLDSYAHRKEMALIPSMHSGIESMAFWPVMAEILPLAPLVSFYTQ